MDDLTDEQPTSKINFVPCLQWVRRGVAKENPDKVELTGEELEAIVNQTKSEIDDLEEESNEIIKRNGQEDEKENNDDDDDDEFDFAHYDDDNGKSSVLNIGNIVVSASTSKDPYGTINTDDDSEEEDDLIRPGDNLVLVGHVEGDACNLEVYVYNEEEGSFYVHHDVMLPSFPLCIEWLGYEPQSKGAPGNLCAIGTMSPVIEIWDLDIIDCIVAVCKLGKKRNKKKGIKSVGHKDAVLDLSWNTIFPHILASGSVDQTVLLWDLDNCCPASKFSVFNEKVQTLMWHPFESQTLLTGCCDGMARVFDCRTEDSFKQWSVDGEVERVLWNHFDPFYFFVGTNSGKVYNIDCRSDLPVWHLNAHSKEVTGLSLSAQCPGLLVSGSPDGQVKIWDLMKQEGKCGPVLVNEKDIGIGAVHCLEANPNSPFVFCAGGDFKSNNLKLWHVMRDDVAVQQAFSSRQLVQPVTVKEEESVTVKSGVKSKPDEDEPMDTTSEATEALQSLSLGQSRFKKTKKKKKVRTS